MSDASLETLTEPRARKLVRARLEAELRLLAREQKAERRLARARQRLAADEDRLRESQDRLARSEAAVAAAAAALRECQAKRVAGPASPPD